MAEQIVWFVRCGIVVSDEQRRVDLGGVAMVSNLESWALIREGNFTRRHNARRARVNRVMSGRENPIHSRDVMSSRMTNLDTGDEFDSDSDVDPIFNAMCWNKGRRVGFACNRSFDNWG